MSLISPIPNTHLVINPVQSKKIPSKRELKENKRASYSALFWTALGVGAVYKLFDQGLAYFLGLETLKHGTGPHGYIGINLNGADPSFGGGETGSSQGIGQSHHVENSKRFFHVFKDTAARDAICGEFFDTKGFGCKLVSDSATTILSKIHAAGSGAATFGFNSYKKTPCHFQGILGGVLGYLTPTLKFKFHSDKVTNCAYNCIFENDPDYDGVAYRTSKPISTSNLGIMGSLKEGLNAKTINTMFEDPYKLQMGILYLGAALVVAKITYSYAKKHWFVPSGNLKEAPKSEKNEPKSQSLSGRVRNLSYKLFWTWVAVSIISFNIS